jgi:hypothetical protein
VIPVTIGATRTVSKTCRKYLNNILGKSWNPGTTNNSHDGHCTHTYQCINIKHISHAKNVTAQIIDAERLQYSIPYKHGMFQVYNCKLLLLFSLAVQPSVGYGLLVSRGFVITHNDAPQSLGLLLDEWSARRRDFYVTTHTTDKHPWPRWGSNLQSQQASGRRPTP